MKLSTILITNKDTLNNFLLSGEIRPFARFFQSWEWGEFQLSLGKEVERLGFNEESGRLAGVATIIYENGKFAKFAYSPRGPVCDYSNEQLFEAIVKQLIAHVSLRSDTAFLRFDPAMTENEQIREVYSRVGTKDAVVFSQVERSWIADIEGLTDFELLSSTLKNVGLKGNTRRGYQKAKSAGVTIRESNSTEDLETFVKLLSSLNQRKGIDFMSEDYYRRQFVAMSSGGLEKMFFAEYEGEILAAAIISIFGDEACYLHGASTTEHRDLMAPHFLQFEMMMSAAKLGVKKYNFWGVVSEKNMRPDHPRAGYSFFKRSFGGREELYIRGQDYVIKSLPYHLNRTWEWARKIKNRVD